jgi:hypothetical protein
MRRLAARRRKTTTPGSTALSSAAALLAAVAASVSPAAGLSGEAAENALLLPPEACAPCHPQHFEEWSGSMHAYAVTDPVFHAMHALGQAETGGALGDFCIRCHSPAGTKTGEIKPSSRGVEGLSAVASAGVSCEVCHRGVQLKPGRPANASFEFTAGAAMVASLPDPAPNPFHASESRDTLREPAFCGSCHNVSNLRGVPVEKPFDEYRASAFPSRGVRCIDCHMLTYAGRAAVDGPLRTQLHRHDFAGVDVALTAFPRQGFQRREVEAFLRTAALLRVDAPPRVAPGEPFEALVHVKNAGAGHNLPTGPSTERQMWIELTLSDARSRELFRSGALDPNGDLMDHHSAFHPEGATPADAQLTLFTDRFEDAGGREVPFLWQAHRLVEGTIPPLETRTARYRLEAPAAPGEDLSLRVRLLFRAFPPHQLRKLGLEAIRDRFPIFEMAVEEARIAVAAEERPPARPGTIRVPGDLASLAAAFDAAGDGGEVLLGPGTHFVERPLESHGRRLTLRGRDGPEATVIELVPWAAGGERASLLLIEGGAGVALDGLTLRGGRGLDRGDHRAGGAVACFGAEIVASDCTFTDNQADLGGAVYVEDAHAELTGCRFERNRAARSGGALFAGRGTDVVLEGGFFRANAAPEGGAVFLGGAAALTGSTFRANWAFRGGALFACGAAASASESPEARGPPVTIERNLFLGNAASRGGGGVIVQGVRDLFFAQNVVAGNLGGALRIEGGARVDAMQATIVDNLLGGAAAVETGSVLRVRNSIVWGNRPQAVGGAIEHSLVDDPALLGGSNREGLPAFREPPSRWERCLGPEEDCVPFDPESLDPASPQRYRRYVPGSYDLLYASPWIDAGAASDVPDPDGTLPDLGAIHRSSPRKLYVRGDVGADGRVGLEDAAALIEWHFARQPPGFQPRCREAVDVDGNGRLEAADAVLLLKHVLGLGPPPSAPYPSCGFDREGLELVGCADSTCKP